MKKKLVIVGAGAFAEVAYEYFTEDSSYQVVGFAVEREFMKQTSLFNLPIVPLEEIKSCFSPESCSAYVAIVYSQMNRLRTRLMHAVEGMGYDLASYISSNAQVWKNVRIGKHCFIFENNVIQPFVNLGDNIILWSGNHVGHHTSLKNNVFVSSHVVIAGHVSVGENCFIGVNATIANNITIEKDCWIQPSATILKSTKENQLIQGPKSEPFKLPATKVFRIKEPVSV